MSDCFYNGLVGPSAGDAGLMYEAAVGGQKFKYQPISE